MYAILFILCLVIFDYLMYVLIDLFWKGMNKLKKHLK